jgi:hypothetical protein
MTVGVGLQTARNGPDLVRTQVNDPGQYDALKTFDGAAKASQNGWLLEANHIFTR